MNKVIILLGQRVRSGINFVGSTLSFHPEVITLPPDISLGEFNLFRDRTIIDTCFNAVSETSFGIDISVDDQDKFLVLYAQLWLKFFIKKYKISETKTIFIKSYVIDNIDLWERSFPNSPIAIIYRDGRDNVISSIKASNDNRNWYKFSIKVKKKLNFLSGRLFINHTKHWVKTAIIVNDLKVSDRIKLFKYEDLNNSEDEITQLLKHFDLKVDKDIIKDCLNAPVVGSSFRYDEKSISKPNWIPDTDKSKYIFTNKWKEWGLIKKLIFKQIAGKELIKLGYEKDNNW